MSEIAKILLKKEREFVSCYCKNAHKFSDEKIDKKFDKLVKKITAQK